MLLLSTAKALFLQSLLRRAEVGGPARRPQLRRNRAASDLGLHGAARIVRRVAEECGSTAMVLTMHYCGVAVLEAHGASEVRREAATGAHLSTLAFSEAGSRSHFWAPDRAPRESRRRRQSY